MTRVVELDLAQQQVGGLRGWLRQLPRRAGGGQPARARGVRGVRRHPQQPRAAGPDAAELDDRRGAQRPTQEDRQRQVHPRLPRRVGREAGGQGAPDRADDRAARGRRRAPQGVGAADDHCRGAAVRIGGGGRQRARSSDAATSRWDRSTSRWTGPTASSSPGPTGRARRPCSGCCSARSRPDEGAAGLGASVRLGEVDQARGLFLGPQPLARAFGEALPDWPDAEVRTLLAKFGLGAEHVHRPAESLSPGERTRAALALLQAREVNLLVLDEPTNHLDLPAIEQLEQALDSFGGHGAARDARPPDARRRPRDPALARRARAVSPSSDLAVRTGRCRAPGPRPCPSWSSARSPRPRASGAGPRR